MWGILHLAGPIQDVGSEGRRESVFAGVRMYGVGEALLPILLITSEPRPARERLK